MVGSPKQRTSAIISSMKPTTLIITICIITFVIILIRSPYMSSLYSSGVTESFRELSTSKSNSDSNATIVYTTMQLNNMKWVKDVNNINNVIFRGLTSDSSYSTFKDVVSDESSNNRSLLREANIDGPILFVANQYEKETFLSKYKIIADSPAGYFIAFGLPSSTSPMSCSFELAGRTVGFLSATDEVFINAILHGYRINKNDVKMKKINLEGTTYYAEQLLRGVDIVITFIVPKSPFHIWLITQKVVIMGFKKLDWNRLNLFYPYTKMKEVTIKELLE